MLKRIRRTAAEELKIPRDVILGEVLISFVGKHQVSIENYRSILAYDDQTVRLQTQSGKVEIRGKHLRIDYYNQEEMRISGQIRELVFDDGRSLT
ncbi:MAG: YabP/YqfC family sporulation protein [Clostridiales bacterium]|nr:YabP/YqfC family sporulation protein [Clostridiales bacterium]